ncbi:MAG: SLBB domain-containing protein [Treponema sp.]|jgi:electron transport complex protein RnfC|nr:SLBB domain-containing protein [Treponema sp.]
MKVYSFPRGGILYEDSTVPPRTSSVTAFLPGLSVIPLVQHTGARALPVVGVGDYVREGMLIGRGQGPGSANIHAAAPGRVINMVSWKTAADINNEALVIRLEGRFEKLGKKEDSFRWEGLSSFEIERIIADMGIVEMESGGTPVSDILSAFRSIPRPVSVVARCVFDDPWLAADYVLCRERFQAVVEGAFITARASRANRVVFAVSGRERELAGDFLTVHPPGGIEVSTVLVGSRYPQRNRRELELVLRMYEKKEELSLGALLILGPATLAALHDAVKLNKPILYRYVSVGGSAVKTPQVMKVRIGTRIGEVFAECGGFIDKPKRIATGSPLLGWTVVDLDEPIIKTSFAVFALLEKQVGGGPRRSCIGCGECRRVCPVGLDPEELYKWAKSAETPDAVQGRASECHGCCCCEAVCPSRLPLGKVILDSALREK